MGSSRSVQQVENKPGDVFGDRTAAAGPCPRQRQTNNIQRIMKGQFLVTKLGDLTGQSANT